MLRKPLVFLAFVASPAMAQSANTNCTTYGGVTNCHTQTIPGPDYDSINRQQAENQQQLNQSFYNLGLALRARRERAQQRKLIEQQALAAQQQQQAELVQQNLRADVGRLVASGQCASAVNLAASAGNFDLAQQAKSVCTPAP